MQHSVSSCLSRRVGALALTGALTASAFLTACSSAAGPQSVADDDPPSVVDAEQSVAEVPQSEPEPEPFVARTATVTMSGDLLWHSDLWKGPAEYAAQTGNYPYDFSLLFGDIKPIIQGADLAICHQETPLAPDGWEPTSYPMFGSPQEIVPAIADTGWDLCTTSSNHSLDKGFEGLETLLREFDRHGIAHTGTFRSPEERATPTIVTTDSGIKFSVVSATYGTNGIPLPEGKEWSVALIDVDDMLARARAAREAGADIVLAAVHAGEEYQVMPNQQQIDVAEALTASPDIDLVYGHHVHVVQPWDRVNDKWVVYGLGNLIANHEIHIRRAYEGATARFTFTEREDGGFDVTAAEYIPTMVTVWWPGVELRLWPVVHALETGQGETELLEIARQKTAEAVFALGVEGVVER